MKRIRRAMTAGVTAVCALTLGTPLAIAGDTGQKNGRFTAGASGIGDPYFARAGNGGYDVNHYDITGRYQPSTDVWTATTKITAMATADLYRFDLDFVGMEIGSVAVNDKPARWSRTETELVLVPQKKIKSGEPIDVVVTYSGIPHEFPLLDYGIRSGFMVTDDGANVLGQPDSAAGWFPVNDHPLDKALYRFTVTVPENLGVVANGHLVDQDTSDGWTTFTWQADEPMASYLTTIDIGVWDVREWTTESGIPVYDAVDPDLLDDELYPGLGPTINASLARQGEMLEFLEEAFGPYPFSTVGVIVDDQDDLFFALETQTRPVIVKYGWLWDNGDSVVLHELAHQWFGDDVALARWKDIWLNEGFAVYAQWMWAEHEGLFTPQAMFDSVMSGPESISADDPFWAIIIGEPPANDLFNNAVYLRGGLTLQALRQEIGDESFWEVVGRWASENGGGNVTTPQFIALAEEVSGMQLDAFFDIWLFTGEKPEVPTLAGSTARAENPEITSWLDRSERVRTMTRY